ncbi:MAG: zinc-dependent metalloprotease, partial [Myxococcota bacterium]
VLGQVGDIQTRGPELSIAKRATLPITHRHNLAEHDGAVDIVPCRGTPCVSSDEALGSHLSFSVDVKDDEAGFLINFPAAFDLSEVMDTEGWETQELSTRAVLRDPQQLIFESVWSVRTAEGEESELTVRWTVRPRSESSITGRPPLPGVGFFQTGGEAPAITRWDTEKPIHFLVYNVPATYQSAFATGVDAWNAITEELMGRSILTYEFVNELPSSVVTGDLRHNVIEWDLTNQASYGGLATSAHDPDSGQIQSTAILVQGPWILELYTSWFGSASDKSLHSSKAHAFLGKSPGCSLMTESPFFERPLSDSDYETYMQGYFVSLVSHEIGHALGLRHNFKGSLGAQEGAISSSTMEYPWRPIRDTQSVGLYDRTAIEFAYTDREVVVTHPFCTDGDVGIFYLDGDAECAIDDNGDDPFGFFMEHLVGEAFSRAIGSPEQAPEDYGSVGGSFRRGVRSVLQYAVGANTYASQWRSFPGDGSRPSEPREIEQYVVEAIVDAVCGAETPAWIEEMYLENVTRGREAATHWEWALLDLQDVAQALEVDLPALCSPRDALSFEFE